MSFWDGYNYGDKWWQAGKRPTNYGGPSTTDQQVRDNLDRKPKTAIDQKQRDVATAWVIFGAIVFVFLMFRFLS